VISSVNVTYTSFKPIFSGTFSNLNTLMPSTLGTSVSERVQ
jgi:hypothetical protein